MPISFKTTFNGREKARRMLQAMQVRLARDLELRKTEIVVRTKAGRGIDGGGFDAYSAAYASYREKEGRKSSPVDLTFTGQMLQAVTTAIKQVGDTIEGRIFFADAESGKKARYNNETRPFFGLSGEQISKLRAAMIEAMRKR